MKYACTIFNSALIKSSVILIILVSSFGFSQHLSSKWNHYKDFRYKVYIYNFGGEKILTKEFIINNHKLDSNLEIFNLNKGFYIIKLLVNDELIKTQKMMIDK